MSRSVWLAAVCMFLGSAAQAGEKLELKADKGLKLNFVVEQSMAREMEHDGSTMRASSRSRVEYKIEVKETSDEGMTLAVSFGSVKAESEFTGGDAFKFDSAKETDDERSAAIRKAMEIKSTVKVDASGKILEVKGFPILDRGRRRREGRGDRDGEGRGDRGEKTRDSAWQDDDRPRRGDGGQGRGSRRRGGSRSGDGGPVNEGALRRDLGKILAAGIQGQDLESGKTYRLGGERSSSGRRGGGDGRRGRGGRGGERREHKRPEADGDASFKISLQDDDRPRRDQRGRGQGGQRGRGGRGRGGPGFGGYRLKYDSMKKGLFSFSLVQISSGDDAEEKKIGSASYSKADGLLKKFSYKIETALKFGNHKSATRSTLDIVRKRRS